MAREYLERLEALLEPVIRELAAEVEIEVRHFFGGAAAYADSRICISLSPAGLAMKLPEDDRSRLLAQGAEPLRYFPKAPVKKAYVVLPDSVLEDEAKLKLWAERSIAHVLALPD